MPCFDSSTADCTLCPLREAREKRPTLEVTALQPVVPENEAPRMMLVGEAPGARETFEHRPFVGPSGQMLDALLGHAGLRREDLWVTNALLCRPPSNNVKLVDSAVEHCSERLLDEIHFYKPRVIVALGNTALRSLLGKVTDKRESFERSCPDCAGQGWQPREHAGWISKRAREKGGAPTDPISCRPCKGEGRRQVFETRKVLTSSWSITEIAGAICDLHNDPQLAHTRGIFPPETKFIIPTYHPSFLLRDVRAGVSLEGAREESGQAVAGPFLILAAVKHLKRAKSLLTRTADLSISGWICIQALDFRAWLAETPSSALFAVDIETEPLDETIDLKRCPDPTKHRPIVCGIARSTDYDACVLDLRTWDAALLAELRAFLGDVDRRKVFQNGHYDVTVLESWL